MLDILSYRELNIVSVLVHSLEIITKYFSVEAVLKSIMYTCVFFFTHWSLLKYVV